MVASGDAHIARGPGCVTPTACRETRGVSTARTRAAVVVGAVVLSSPRRRASGGR